MSANNNHHLPLRPSPSSGPATSSQTILQTNTGTSQSQPTLRLRGASPPTSSTRRIQWAEDVVDNEGMGKKSSKVCCIYHKPHEPGDSDSDSSESESDSDSEPDLSRARKAGSGGKRGRGKKKDGDGERKEERKPSPNAYERQPKYKGKGKQAEG